MVMAPQILIQRIRHNFPILLSGILLLLSGQSIALPAPTDGSTTPSLFDPNETDTNDLAGPKKPSPPVFPAFENLINHRIAFLNNTAKNPRAPLFILSIQASAYPAASKFGSDFTTLSIRLFSPGSGLVLSTFNDANNPTHWTKPSERAYLSEEWKVMVSYLMPWHLDEKESNISAQLSRLQQAGVGPLRSVFLGGLLPDPWRLNAQLYWIWQTTGKETLWQGDRDHIPRVMEAGVPLFDHGDNGFGGTAGGGNVTELS